MSVTAGLRAELYLDGAMVTLLTGVEFSGDRAQTPWRPMGSYDPTIILKGRRNFEGRATRGYVCGAWLGTFLTNCAEYRATFYPSGTASCDSIGGTCGSFSATIAIKTWRISGMETETETPVLEEITFDAYHVAQL